VRCVLQLQPDGSRAPCLTCTRSIPHPFSVAATISQVMRLPAGSLQLVDVESIDYSGIVTRRARPPRGGGQFGGSDGRGSISYVEANAESSGGGECSSRRTEEHQCACTRELSTPHCPPPPTVAARGSTHAAATSRSSKITHLPPRYPSITTLPPISAQLGQVPRVKPRLTMLCPTLSLAPTFVRGTLSLSN
jgi:hypothetical protein